MKEGIQRKWRQREGFTNKREASKEKRE